MKIIVEKETKLVKFLLDDLVEIDLTEKFLPKPKEKREFCFTDFFKSLWK